MKKSDFQDEDAMRGLCQDVYELLRATRRSLLRVDVHTSKANTVNYKGGLQFLNDAMRRLEFEQETETK